MKRFLFYFFILIVCGYLSFADDQTVAGIAGGIVGGFIIMGLDIIFNNMDRLRYLWESVRYCRRCIRLSISYLYRIKIDDKYLLVKGNRIPGQYQPVGGVIKRYSSSKDFFISINAKDDAMIQIDQTSKDDLRIRIPGNKIFMFMRWFDSAKGREIDAWREFYEELIKTNILPANKFGYIQTNYLSRHVSSIKFSPHAQILERFVAEIYEVNPSEEQEIELRNLMDIQSENYIWANEENILRRGAVPGTSTGQTISPTAGWTL